MYDLCSTIKKWERLAGGPWQSPNNLRRIAFNRTLIADVYRLDEPPDWRELCSESNLKRYNAAVSSGGLTAQDERLLYWRNRFLILQLCVYKRRFFVTAFGRFGLGPPDVEAATSDYVCVVEVARVPLVMRKTPNQLFHPFTGGHHYVFLGQAYVDGIMYGEGRSGQKKQLEVT